MYSLFLLKENFHYSMMILKINHIGGAEMYFNIQLASYLGRPHLSIGINLSYNMPSTVRKNDIFLKQKEYKGLLQVELSGQGKC
jgi:hypothetical protein